MRPQIRDFTDIHTDLLAAIQWIKERGGRVDNSRLSKYLTDVEKLERSWQVDGGRALIQEKSFQEILNSLMEADAIGQTVNTLRQQNSLPQSINSKLFEFISGPVSQEDEDAATSSNRARNLFFELRLAAFLLEAGLPAELGEAPDIKTAIDARPVYLECKRAFSVKAIKNLTSKAINQLLHALARDSYAIGAIAFDFTKITSLNCITYLDQTQARSTMQRKVGKAGEKYEALIFKELRHRAKKIEHKIAGLIEYYDFPVYNETTKRWGTGWILEIVGLKGTPGAEVLGRLEARLRAAIQSAH